MYVRMDIVYRYICMCICVYMCAYVHTYVHIYMHILHTYIHVYMLHIDIFLCMYMCIHICLYVRTHGMYTQLPTSTCAGFWVFCFPELELRVSVDEGVRVFARHDIPKGSGNTEFFAHT